MARDLTQGRVLRQLMQLAVPTMLANALQIVYSMVDMIVIGRFVGSAGISAVAAASDILMFTTTFSMGICAAGQVIISQYIGKNERESVGRTIGTMFTFILAAAIILSAIALPCTKGLLGLINTPPEAWNMAIDYFRVSVIGLIFVFGYNAVSSMLRGMGDGKHPLIFVGIATVLNMILDVLFVGPLKMAALGAALATVIGQGVSFIFSLFYLQKNHESFGFDFKLKSFVPDSTIFKMFIKLGIPMALQHMIVNISSVYVASLVNSYGVVCSSLAGIGTKLRMIIGAVSGSVGTAGATMTGQNFSAGNFDRVKKIYWYSLGILVVVCFAVGMIGVLFPTQVIGLFDTNPEIIPMAKKFMVINLAVFISFAFYQPGVSLLNGMGYASFSFAIGIIDGLVARIGLVFLLGKVFDLGIWGIWWGASIAGFVGATILFIYFLTGHWKKRSAIIDK